MALTKKEWLALEEKAAELRKLCCQTTRWAGSGHIGGSLSSMDVLTLLYYKYAKLTPEIFEKDDNRNRIVVSKGHIGIGLAGILSDLGFVDKEDLKTFNKTGSKLGIHLDSNKVKGMEASTGSLGHGSNLALGMALAAKVKGLDYKVFTILGDGELDEGSVWEAAMCTAHYKANNLITIVDRNHNMIDGNTEDVMKLEPLADKWTAFGFETRVVDGHDMQAIAAALEEAMNCPKDSKPFALIMDTKKGYGIDYMEDNYKWHYGSMNDEQFDLAMKSLDKVHKARIARVEKEGK